MRVFKMNRKEGCGYSDMKWHELTILIANTRYGLSDAFKFCFDIAIDFIGSDEDIEISIEFIDEISKRTSKDYNAIERKGLRRTLWRFMGSLADNLLDNPFLIKYSGKLLLLLAQKDYVRFKDLDQLFEKCTPDNHKAIGDCIRMLRQINTDVEIEKEIKAM